MTDKPLVVVLMHGGPIDISDMLASPRVGAVLTTWYPGQAGGAALADILLGRVSPSGAPAAAAGGRCWTACVMGAGCAWGQPQLRGALLCRSPLTTSLQPPPSRPRPLSRPPAADVVSRQLHAAAAHDRHAHAG